MVVIWIPTGDPGWTLEPATPHDAPWIGGGIRTMYELAAAVAAGGRAVEVRGAVSLPQFEAVCEAAGARPGLPAEPRALTASDTVIVPEGIADPAVHARLALSPARAILMLLGPLGLVGWPFTSDWTQPDSLEVPIDAVARSEHFGAASALGFELWTHSPGMQRAAREGGVPCQFIGSGNPGGYPDPLLEKDIDVAWMSGNRWAPLARPTVDELSRHGIECVGLESASHGAVLELFGRARVVLHPLRIEGHSRIGCEARAMGAVPVVLDTNPFAVGLDEAGGAVAVADPSAMPGAVLELLADRPRLARMSATACATARAQVDWEPYVSRVAAALDSPADDVARGARAAIGRALAEKERARASEPEQVRERADHDDDALESANRSRRPAWRLRARARRRGQPARTDPSLDQFFGEPRGYLDGPPPGTELTRGPLTLSGWTLFPGTSVARVEVSVGGGAPERARIAVDRPEIRGVTDHPDAPICAFEHTLDLSELPRDVRRVSVEAVAYALDGRQLALAPSEYAVAAPVAHVPRHSAEGVPRRPRARAGGAIRLLAFTQSLEYGGAPLYLYDLLRRLVRADGIDCQVVTFEDGPLRRVFEDAGLPVHASEGLPVTSVELYEARLAELTGWSATCGADVAVVNTMGGFPGADVAGRLGIPAVWVIHESYPLPMFWSAGYPSPGPHPHVRAQAEQSLRSTAAVVFVAGATRDLLLPHVDADRALTLPYGIDLEAIDVALRERDRDAVRRRFGIAPDARVVLCMATVEPRNAQALLAQAFAQVAGRHPDAVLALVGAADGDHAAGYRDALREYLERAGMASRVRIELVTQDPYDWHLAADLLVCASDVESLPRSIAESMAFGTPVVSTRVFGLAELVEDGRSGWLCEPRDLGEMASGLDRALGAGEQETAAVVRAARERVRTRHDGARQADLMLSLIRGLAEKPEALPAEILATPRLSSSAPRMVQVD